MIRKAAIKDIKAIHELLQIYGDRGELLPRPLSKLYESLRDFWVFPDEGGDGIIGCCALQFCWDDLAEIRSMAVDPEHVRKGIGTRLVEKALSEAKTFDLNQVFTLTYRPGFFERFGFSIVDRSRLPLKVWSDCILCVKFPDCDEIAMFKKVQE